MNTGKIYYDMEGNPRTIWQMVKESPEWAANRIQEGEKAIEEVERLKAELDELYTLIQDASSVMTLYARENPKHEWHGQEQDPCGAHAWLLKFRSITPEAEVTP